MKRSLQLIDDSEDPPAQLPQAVAIGERLVSIVDTGDGRSCRRFVELLLDAGAAQANSVRDANIDLRVVIRGTPESPATRLRAEALEEAADLVLGSARPAFARLFASACARWVNG